MARPWHLRFAPDVARQERQAVARALAPGLADSRRILHDHSTIKAFYRLETEVRPLFVKMRTFRSFLRRLGRTVGGTKEEKEFQKFLELKRRGVPCPAAVATGRMLRSGLVWRSIELLEFLPDARTVREELVRSTEAGPLLDALVEFLLQLRDKGLVHRDLQWNNLLVLPAGSVWRFLVIDALHVHWARGAPHDAFARTLLWFVTFMVHEDAPAGFLDALLGRLAPLGIETAAERRRMLDEARRWAGKL